MADDDDYLHSTAFEDLRPDFAAAVEYALNAISALPREEWQARHWVILEILRAACARDDDALDGHLMELRLLELGTRDA